MMQARHIPESLSRANDNLPEMSENPTSPSPSNLSLFKGHKNETLSESDPEREHWLTKPPVGVTPTFSRAALCNPNVNIVLPLSPREYRQRVANRDVFRISKSARQHQYPFGAKSDPHPHGAEGNEERVQHLMTPHGRQTKALSEGCTWHHGEISRANSHETSELSPDDVSLCTCGDDDESLAEQPRSGDLLHAPGVDEIPIADQIAALEKHVGSHRLQSFIDSYPTTNPDPKMPFPSTDEKPLDFFSNSQFSASSSYPSEKDELSRLISDGHIEAPVGPRSVRTQPPRHDGRPHARATETTSPIGKFLRWAWKAVAT